MLGADPHHYRVGAPHLQLRSDSPPATRSDDMEQVEDDLSSLEQTESNEKVETNGLKDSLSSTSSALDSCDLETVTETNHHDETSTMKEFSEERHCREEVTQVLEQEETIERVNVSNSVQVSEVNLMINAEVNQEKQSDIRNEKVSLEMTGNSHETVNEGQITIGLYKEEVFMTAIEEIVVLTNENVNYTTESAEKTNMNFEETVETILIDQSQEVNGTSKEDNLENGKIEVEAENCLESGDVSQYFSAEDTFNVSQDVDCTEETAWTFSKQITSEVENISSHKVESEDTVLVTSVSDSASETKTSSANQNEIMTELEVKLTFLFMFDIRLFSCSKPRQNLPQPTMSSSTSVRHLSALLGVVPEEEM